MKLLITGGAGFIGSHLCEKYTKEGHKVYCLDNFMNGNLRNVRGLLDYKNFKLIKGDIRDKELIDKLVSGVDVVCNLAAQIHVDRSYIDPVLTYDINVNGTQNVLEAAKFHDVRVIQASTSEVYGSALYAPIDENHPLNAPHPYGASKIAADRMCYAYQKAYNMDINILRFFNVFGPRQKDLGYGGVISIFTNKVLRGIAPTVYGDGNQTRDYTYIDDVVRAYDMVLNYKGDIKEPINFGTGKEVSINEIAEKIIKFCNSSVTPNHDKKRIGEVERLICSYEHAFEILRWSPKHSFDASLEKYVEWYKQYGFEERITVE